MLKREHLPTLVLVLCNIRSSWLLVCLITTRACVCRTWPRVTCYSTYARRCKRCMRRLTNWSSATVSSTARTPLCARALRPRRWSSCASTGDPPPSPPLRPAARLPHSHPHQPPCLWMMTHCLPLLLTCCSARAHCQFSSSYNNSLLQPIPLLLPNRCAKNHVMMGQLTIFVNELYS